MEIDITDKEIQAIENVITYAIADEYDHCKSELPEGEFPEQYEDGTHIWYSLITLQALLLKLGRI